MTFMWNNCVPQFKEIFKLIQQTLLKQKKSEERRRNQIYVYTKLHVTTQKQNSYNLHLNH